MLSNPTGGSAADPDEGIGWWGVITQPSGKNVFTDIDQLPGLGVDLTCVSSDRGSIVLTIF